MEGVKSWLAPLTGALAVIACVASAVLIGETPDATEESAAQVAEFYVDNKDQVMGGSFLFGLGGLLFVFFGGWLRRLLRDAEGPNGLLSAVAFGGTVVFAAGASVAATLGFALADTADDIDPVALEALNAFSWNYFIPFAVGLSLVLVSAGLSIIRHRALPAWLGWVGLIIGIACYTPAGFFAAILAGLWILGVSIMCALQRRGAPAGGAGGATTVGASGATPGGAGGATTGGRI
jgi:Domain of unknown function (DUF4386)